MDERLRRYPIGIQNFEDLRNNGYVYVDKTELIYRLTNTNKVYFLSRPRRFGKSLLVSTLEAYFSGKKDLFNGLAMETLEKEWAVYPVPKRYQPSLITSYCNGKNYMDAKKEKRLSAFV